MITWATSGGGDRVVPAASTIKIFVASAFWRAGLDVDARATVRETPWSLADRLRGPLTLGDCALLMLAFSDNAATNVLLDELGFEAVNEEARRLGAERTQIRRRMMGEGPENLTCAGDLARGMAAIEEPRIIDALGVAHDSELPFRLPQHEVVVKTVRFGRACTTRSRWSTGTRRWLCAPSRPHYQVKWPPLPHV